MDAAKHGSIDRSWIRFMLFERLRTALLALARLRHPNLLVVHDVVVERARRALVMELLEGTTLARLLRVSQPRLGVDETIRIAERSAAAVEHAHQRGVLHGDSKP